MHIVTDYILTLCVYSLLAVLISIYGELMDVAMILSVGFCAVPQIPYY